MLSSRTSGWYNVMILGYLLLLSIIWLWRINKRKDSGFLNKKKVTKMHNSWTAKGVGVCIPLPWGRARVIQGRERGIQEREGKGEGGARGIQGREGVSNLKRYRTALLNYTRKMVPPKQWDTDLLNMNDAQNMLAINWSFVKWYEYSYIVYNYRNFYLAAVDTWRHLVLYQF